MLFEGKKLSQWVRRRPFRMRHNKMCLYLIVIRL